MFKPTALRIASHWLDGGRTGTVYKNILLSLLLKGASIAISFLLIPLTLNYVNKDNFGIWMTISAFTLWFGLIDVSFGNGLRNQLVNSFAKKEFDLARSFISTLYLILIGCAIALAILIYIVNTNVDWISFLHVGREYLATVRQVVIIVLIGFSTQIVLKPINAILLADQRASMTSWLLLIGNALTLLGIYAATQYTTGSLITLAYIQSASPVLVLTTASIWLFTTRYRHIAPSIRCVRLSLSKQLFNTGSQFLFLQIVSVLMFSSGNLIVSYFLGTEEVTVFSIANRYFGIIPLLYGIIITPYWSAFTDAYVKQDYTWISETLLKLNRLATLTIIAALLMVQFADIAYAHWVGTQVKIPLALSIAFSCYTVSYAFLSNYNYFINGVGKLRLLVYASFGGMILFIPLNYLFVSVLKLDLPGVVWVSTMWNVVLLGLCRMQTRKILAGTARGIWNR